MKKIILLLFTTVVFSCTNASEDDLIDKTPPPILTTYNADVKAIIENNCLFCHKSPPVNGAPMSLTSYSDVKNAVENRGLLIRINSTTNPMPKGGLMSQINRDIIQKWKDDGLLEQ